ncbi:kielin/chordin-like protein [Pollicipes pollicipes]|uniref:kielin/chordin-like protein n=1 Tax=Pollicipes pollicipes TaxID=41117 RepID=UPI001884D7D2|nr:kielin/chordin-like protein [Pollicipes pollicipes]
MAAPCLQKLPLLLLMAAAVLLPCLARYDQCPTKLFCQYACKIAGLRERCVACYSDLCPFTNSAQESKKGTVFPSKLPKSLSRASVGGAGVTSATDSSGPAAPAMDSGGPVADSGSDGAMDTAISSPVNTNVAATAASSGAAEADVSDAGGAGVDRKHAKSGVSSCFHGGVYRALYTTWYDMAHCNLYACTMSGVQVTRLADSCMDAPDHLGDCTRYRPANQCCYNYHCTFNNITTHDDCVYLGVTRPHGTSWVDDNDHPCVRFYCNDGAVVVLSDVRPLCPAPPSHDCVGYQLLHQCCNGFNCSVVQDKSPCFEADGTRREDGSVWYDDDIFPCVKFICLSGEIQVLVDRNSSCAPAPDPTCAHTRQVGHCCATFSECPCEFDGQTYAHDTLFVDSVEHPCRTLRCDNGTIVTVNQTDCESLDCTLTVWPAGECCRECVGCVYDGVQRPEGSIWFDNQDLQCTFFQCTNGQVQTVGNITCDPAPSPGCVAWFIPGVCCPKWDCQEAPCVLDGVTREHGATWPQNPLKPCVFLGCNNSVVTVVDVAAPCPPALGPPCVERDVPYQCCPTYDCVNVTCPYAGQTYNEGDVWVDNPLHPCKWFTCLRTGVELVNSTLCPPLVPPNCPAQRNVTQCCKMCVPSDGSGCFDALGNPRSEGELYYNDPEGCLLVRCQNGQEVLVIDRTTLCQPPDNVDDCVVVGVQDCCPIYNCTTQDTNLCMDAYGHPRAEGELYYNDLDHCLLMRCENGQEVLVVDRSTLCIPPDNIEFCVVVGVDDCCPVYNCTPPGVTNCTDAAGEQHAEGEMYYDDAAQCVLVTCVNGSEVVEVNKTDLCDPPPQNPLCTVLAVLDCCPIYRCPDCVFNGCDTADRQRVVGRPREALRALPVL